MQFTALQARHANYACTALALAILFARVAISIRRHKVRDLSFFLVSLSIVVVAVRVVVNYYYLLYGTANDAIHHAGYFNTHDLEGIKKGSILSLVSRILLTLSCWLQICLLLLFYSQLMQSITWVRWTIRATWTTVVVSFVAIFLATFLECRPFRLYWQVSPDPGSCVKAYVQILLQCVSNIILDLMLLAISWPIIYCTSRTWKQHLRVGVLFILGFFCIIVTVLRLVSVYDSGSAQPTRSLWASIQILVSTFVANVPTIYGELTVAKRKRGEVLVRRKSRPEVWGPDAEAAYLEQNRPERVATITSQVSECSSRKEWFDHFEDIERPR